MPSFIQIPYQDALPGDIGLLAGVGLLSDAIRDAERIGGELTDSSFEPSHAFIFAQDAILEAVFPRVALRAVSEYATLQTRVFRASDSMPKIPLPVALRSIEARWLGAPYDLAGVLGMSMVELEEALGEHRLSDILASGSARWCSELAADWVDTYLAPTPMLRGSVTSPAKLYDWLRTV
jgi:hypothetical protein